MEKTQKVNKMETMPIFKLLISMALPMIISMFVQSLYNLVDSIFVGQFSKDALTAVGLAFPMQNLIIAFAVGIGVGINATLSKTLGEKDHEKANEVAKNGIFIILIVAAIFALVGSFIVEPYMKALTSNEAVIKYGIEYLIIVMCCSIGCFLAITFERLLQSTGKTFYVMIVQMSGAITNIILDYVFIFVLHMGVKGAALATVAGQILSAILGLIFNIFLNKEISLNIKGFKIKKAVIKEILVIGVPSIVMNAITSVLTFLFNFILQGFKDVPVPGGNGETYGDDPQTILGIYFKLNGIFFMPVFGLSNGLVPIVAYNYGAQRKEQVVKTIKYSTLIALVMMSFGTIMLMAFPKQLISMFAESEEVANQLAGPGSYCLRIISISFIFAAINIVFSSTFQALGNGFYSMIVSFVRQLIVLLPVAYLLSFTKNLNLVWVSYIIAELVALLLSSTLFVKIYKHKVRHLGGN